jgi:glycerol-3-phosphate cytidylyltransferase
MRGFICGVFDLFHYGHLLAFEECKTQCDHLTVAVNKAENIDPIINPGKMPPIFPWQHRVALLKSCRLVDEVLVYNSEQELTELLRIGSYHVRFLGDDYKGKSITGAELVPNIYYTSRSHGFSTSSFKKELMSRQKTNGNE